MKHVDPQISRSGPANGRVTPANAPSHGSDQEGHARTHAMLASLLDKMERATTSTRDPAPSNPLARLLSGTPSGLMGFISNLGGAWAVVATLGAVLLRLLPALPQAAHGVFSILLPFAILTGTAVAIVTAGGWIKRKSTRMKFLTGVMSCYSVATAVYLLWVSAGFLRFNTLPSGFLLATCWYGAVSVLRKTIPEVREMLALIDLEVNGEKKRQEKMVECP